MKSDQDIFKIANKYSIKESIGKGKFGEVYKGINDKTKESVAIKLESSRTPTKLLKHETTLLKYLYDHDCRNIPTVYWYGVWSDFSCLIMPFYECSLFDKIKTTHKSEPLLCINKHTEKINAVMGACIDIIESIHKNFIIHRDIKPQNFMICSGDIYLIDFGLSTFYIGENREHIIDSSSHEYIIGTPKYVGFNIHDGVTPSRRDDLISLGYMYIWMICGELPWDGIIDDTSSPEIIEEGHILHNKNQQRKTLKSWDNLNPICLKINQNIYKYLNYLYCLCELGSRIEPNYYALRKLFE